MFELTFSVLNLFWILLNLFNSGAKVKKTFNYKLYSFNCRRLIFSPNYLCRLKEIESKLEKKGMRIHNIHSAQQHLRLGQLRGNHFDIVVRDLKHHSHDSPVDLKERISEAMENIEVKSRLAANKEQGCNGRIIAIFPSLWHFFCCCMAFLHYSRNWEQSCLLKGDHMYIHSVLRISVLDMVQKDRWGVW